MKQETAQLSLSNPSRDSARTTSRFEFWPAWIMYLPVVVQWLLLAMRYRSLTVAFIANPKLTLSGMVGVGKSELLSQANPVAAAAILPWIRFVRSDESAAHQVASLIEQASVLDISLPFVCKPDIGCRGSGVKLIQSIDQLTAVLNAIQPGTALLLQQLARFEPEVGIFYTREVTPRGATEAAGKITGLTLKTTPSVIGDGQHTLNELVQRDPRARSLLHLYQPRLASRWHQVPIAGERVRLVFSASHCRGAVFTDAKHHITPQLSAAVERIMRGLPEFHYGRLDVKFRDIAALEAGLELEIVEINGASAESIHIWDRKARLLDAWKTLMWQYRTLFRMGDAQRQFGYKPPGLRKLVKHWLLERRLSKTYVLND